MKLVLMGVCSSDESEVLLKRENSLIHHCLIYQTVMIVMKNIVMKNMLAG